VELGSARNSAWRDNDAMLAARSAFFSWYRKSQAAHRTSLALAPPGLLSRRDREGTPAADSWKAQQLAASMLLRNLRHNSC